jgi:hypothetical protein
MGTVTVGSAHIGGSSDPIIQDVDLESKQVHTGHRLVLDDRSTVARSVVAGRLGGGGPMHPASAALEMASTGPMVVRKNT